MTDNIPKGWVQTTLGEVVDVLDSQRVPINNEERRFRRGNIPYFGATGQVGWIDSYLFDEELILLGEDGAPFLDSVKPKAYLIRGKSWVNNHAHVLRACSGVLNAFVLHQLNQVDYRDFISGTTRMKLPQGSMRRIPLVVAPLREQERIVAKLDILLSRVAAGEAAARRALDRLHRYRAAVLHAAVTGELTRDWRKTRPPEETGAQLVKRLLTERRARWEAAGLKRLRGAGKSPKDETWKMAYPTPRSCRITADTKLPFGWAWASIEQISTRVTVGHVGLMKTEYVKQGIPFLRSQNIRPNRFDPAGLLYIRRSFHKQLAKSTVFPGDVAVVRSGNVGTTCVIPESLGEANCADLVLIQRPLINPHFLSFYMNSAAQKHVVAGKVGVALTHFNTGSVASLAIAVPPKAEQAKIVRKVERYLAAADRLLVALNQQLKRAQSTRQSILREAFVGNLVPQNPSDEPASALLERIRIAREIEAKKPKAKRMPKPKTTSVRRPLLDVLRKKKTITPEQLFREAGFERSEVDLFYRELLDIRKFLYEEKPIGAAARSWPERAKVYLRLKENLK